MSPLSSLADFLGKGGRRIGTPELQLSDWTVTHTGIDGLRFANYADDSPRFHRVAIDEAPTVTPEVADPEPIDMTTATPEAFVAYQQAKREADAKRAEAPQYSQWQKLTRDVFASYHTHDRPELIDTVDPSVALHRRILPKLTTTDEHAQARNVTRDDPKMAAIATMAAVDALRNALGEELQEQMREAEQYADAAQQAAEAHDRLEALRDQARELHQQGQPIPRDLVQQIKDAVHDRRGAQQGALDAAAQQTPMSADAMAAIQAAAAAGHTAAENAANLPSFGAGIHDGEPSYESPEQALSIAEMWANNPTLRAVAERFGRFSKDIRFHRAKRVVGGNDEIVDVEFGDNLNRVLPAELALLADEDTELDFLARYASGELLCFSTVGEENAGRGPIVCVIDGSASMNGERNIWTRAVAMCLLHIARIEKRDFACIEFSGPSQVEQWVFEAQRDMPAERIVEMASHFFHGGTVPINGIAAAAKLMQDAAPFKKADIVILGDGEASFGNEDKRLRDQLTEMGVRLYGIGIGGSFAYLASYCEHVVSVHDFALADPSDATRELAVHMT